MLIGKDKTDKKTDLRSRFESMEKIGVLGLAITYFVGLLVVSLYLRGFGVAAPASFFRVQYISAGALALLPIGVAAYTVFALHAFLTSPSLRDLDGRRHRSKSRSSLYIMAAFMPLLSTVAIGNYVLDVKFAATDWLFLVVPFILATAALAVHTTVSSSDGTYVRVASNTLGATGIMFLFGYFLFFAELYARIPAYVGGGEPIPVLLVCNDETKKNLQELDVKFTDEKNTSQQVLLLYASESEYFIDVPYDRKYWGMITISLKKDRVQAIRYLPNEPQRYKRVYRY